MSTDETRMCAHCGRHPVRQFATFCPGLTEYARQCINNARRTLRQRKQPVTEAKIRALLGAAFAGLEPAPAQVVPLRPPRRHPPAAASRVGVADELRQVVAEREQLAARDAELAARERELRDTLAATAGRD
jgi:hypothetical protein